MNSPTQLKPRLTRREWVAAALDLLTEVGIGAVSVDRLAINLGITRGSFYHHFSDRRDLLQALLDYWAKRWTYDVIEQVNALGLDPGTALLALMRTIRSNNAAAYDAPIRAWALHDMNARAVVKEVDKARLKIILSLFTALGFSGLDALNRARLFLHYEMAAPAMFATPTPEQDEQLLLERHQFLTATN